MEEVVCPLSALVVGFALSHLVLVVGKGQVHPSRVDIQLIPKDVAAKTGRPIKGLHVKFGFISDRLNIEGRMEL